MPKPLSLAEATELLRKGVGKLLLDEIADVEEALEDPEAVNLPGRILRLLTERRVYDEDLFVLPMMNWQDLRNWCNDYGMEEDEAEFVIGCLMDNV